MWWCRKNTLRRPRARKWQLQAAAMLAVVTVLAAACGFHLQGSTPMSPVMKVTYVDTEDARSPFLLTLLRSLETSGAAITPDRAAATAVLRIERDETGQRVLSVSASNHPTEYEIFYTVKYSVSAGGKELLTAQTLTLTRDYSFDETTLLANEHEEDILREALARDLAGLVMSRLTSL
jgi:LPS-assembly lipoprotein